MWNLQLAVASTFDIEIKVTCHFSMFVLKRHAIDRFIGLTTFGDVQSRNACAAIEFCFEFHSFSNFDLSFVPTDPRKRVSINDNFCECRLTWAEEMNHQRYD